MIYISIVGTQVMAVLNPLFAIQESTIKISGIDISRVFLMPTSKTIEYAERISRVIKKLPKDIHIETIPISSSTSTDTSGNPPAHDAISSALEGKKKFIFNVAGGMNFQVSCCVSKLAERDVFWVYPEQGGIHLYQWEKGELKGELVLNLPSPIDVFSYQGIKHKVVGGKRNPLLNWALGGTTRNMIKGVEIGGVLFDLVSNVVNELRFLKVIHKGEEDTRPDKIFLEQARQLIEVAAGRSEFGELFHRGIGLLTNHSPVADHVENESGGKIRVFNSNGYSQDVIQGELRAFMSGPKSRARVTDKKIEEITTGNKISNERALLVALGLNSMSTLTAVETHRPKSLYLFYTPHVESIKAMVAGLERGRDQIPAEKVHLIPTDITGSDVLDFKDVKEKEIHVNISPGTKAQTAFLTKWALKNSANVFSLLTTRQRAVSLTSGDSIKMRAPSSAKYLKMIGIETSTGKFPKNEKKVIEKDHRVKSVLELLKFSKENSKALDNFPKEAMRAGPFVFDVQNDKCTLCKNRKPIASWHQWEWGSLFEKIVGAAVLRAGAEHVFVQLKIPWSSEDIISYLAQRHGTAGHRSEIDVVAVKGGDYFVISCKGGQRFSIKKAAQEVAAVSHIFGRFAVPLLCTFTYEKDPYEINGVFRFGWRTLVDKEAMSKLLEIAVNKRRKTL